MKKLSLFLLFVLVILSPFVFQSCDDDDGYSAGNFLITMSTVERLDGESRPYFVWDNNQAVWVAASRVPFVDLKTGQRVWANFTLLSDRNDQFAHDVRLNDYVTVLTKGIIDLTEEIQYSIGNSKATITRMWLDNDYLNVYFWMVAPTSEKHMVNLVRNKIDVPEQSDGYLHLEYRYNDMGDTHGRLIPQIVSFKLNTFNNVTDEAKPRGLKVKINSIKNGERVITLDYPAEDYITSMSLEDGTGSNEIN